MFSTIHFSSKNHKFKTPIEAYKELDNEFHFSLDPCNPPIDKKFKPLQNGLLQHWPAKSRAFLNPDYKKTDRWILKAYREIVQKRCELAVFLLPARTDTEWFDFVVNKQCEIRKNRGRLRFGDEENSAPFPSIVVIMRENNCKF